MTSLYAILDADASRAAGWTPSDLATAYLNGGARFLQLRAKTMAGAEFLDLASKIAALARAADAVLIINDRGDIARLAGAHGLHVGQDDLSPRAARTVIGETALLGQSTHTLEQVERALDEPINYLAVGPVFGTTTKATGYEAIGLDRVRAAAARAAQRGLPLVAIGGVTLDRAPSVIARGAASVAVISDLLSTGDPEARVREFLKRLNMAGD
ncbi:MAG: thiamine phosphate synthase [Acidobacteria bacterium]|nr:thiamine phosphate synthase [Acidobacteriota bacterium]